MAFDGGLSAGAGERVVNGKRLFWISLIIVELVLVYVLWRPHRSHPMRTAHRPASVPAAVPKPQVKSPEVVASAIPAAAAKPTAAIHEHRSWRKRPPVVNAALTAREPLAPKASLAPTTPLSPMESFWCRLSTVESQCDCKGNIQEQASNRVLR